MAHTDRFGGAWLPVRYEDVAAALGDASTFSSTDTDLSDDTHQRRLVMPPITMDAPDHMAYRRVLLPPFTVKEVEKLAPRTRELCDSLIDGFIHAGEAGSDYARHIPVLMTARLLGLPESDADRFREWVHQFIELGVIDTDLRSVATLELLHYFTEQLELRRGDGGDDLISWVAGGEVHGEPIPERRQTAMLLLLLIGGIDTTWSALGASLLHLATHPEDQARLRAEPGLLGTAIEEFLRFYAPVEIGRLIAKDSAIGGCPVRAGEKVLVSFPAANRDPEVFEDADRVVIDRKNNRHLAFGVGAHRCLGSNLARMELRVALQTWLKRVPTFALRDDAAVTFTTGGNVRGPRSIPIAFNPEPL